MNRFPFFSVALLALGLLLTGCGDRMTPVQRLQAGEYILEVLTPGGVFQAGENPVAIQVVHGNHTMPISGGTLAFSMPAMGSMPAMSTNATLTPTDGQLVGTVSFSMAGGWNASLEATISDGPLRGTFTVQVE